MPHQTIFTNVFFIAASRDDGGNIAISWHVWHISQLHLVHDHNNTFVHQGFCDVIHLANVVRGLPLVIISHENETEWTCILHENECNFFSDILLWLFLKIFFFVKR